MKGFGTLRSLGFRIFLQSLVGVLFEARFPLKQNQLSVQPRFFNSFKLDISGIPLQPDRRTTPPWVGRWHQIRGVFLENDVEEIRGVKVYRKKTTKILCFLFAPVWHVCWFLLESLMDKTWRLKKFAKKKNPPKSMSTNGPWRLIHETENILGSLPWTILCLFDRGNFADNIFWKKYSKTMFSRKSSGKNLVLHRFCCGEKTAVLRKKQRK